ncbi:MAG: MFS transporter [Coriobacteriaceae bacterium]|nr:MFS transporter [Coriobacteriaceae bacterium]
MEDSEQHLSEEGFHPNGTLGHDGQKQRSAPGLEGANEQDTGVVSLSSCTMQRSAPGLEGAGEGDGRTKALQQPWKTNKWAALGAISLGTLVTSVNASSINIANPVLAGEFGISMAQVQWVVTVYLIVVSSFMLLFGRVGDRRGSHRVYIAGCAIFSVGTLLCALSGGLPDALVEAFSGGSAAVSQPGSLLGGLLGPLSRSAVEGTGESFVFLLVARGIQALGAAMMLATGMALVSTIFPQAQRGTAIGMTVLMVGIGNMCGPSAGGLILSFASWPMIFAVNLPVMCVATLLAACLLRSPVPPVLDSPPLDTRGAFVLAGLISSAIVGLSGGFTGSQWFLLLLVALIPVFILVERKQAQPLLDRKIMRNRRFSLGNLVTFLSYAAGMMVSFQVPFFLEQVWEMSVGEAGMLLAMTALGMAVTGPLSGILSDRVGALRVMPASLVLLVGALVMVFFLPSQPSIPYAAVCLVLVGCGMGTLNTPNNSEIMTAAGRRFASYASGFVATNRNLAFCLGTAASAGLFSLFRSVWGQSLPDDAAYLFAFRCVIGLTIALMAASLVLCLHMRKVQAAPQAGFGE